MNLNEAKQEIVRLTAHADGWRAIAAALVGVAFDLEYRFESPMPDGRIDDTPPLELLRDLGFEVDITTEDGKSKVAVTSRPAQPVTVNAVRAALLGRVYRITSDDGTHHEMCSYPLCPNRDRKVPKTEVTWSQPDKLTTKVQVCEGTHDPGKAADECLRWAQWIAARVAGGAVKLVP